MAISNRVIKKRVVDEDNPYWLSFSDIMSGLLLIFILASLYLMIELQTKLDKFDQSTIELNKANQTRTKILYEIKEDLLKKGIFVEVVDNKTVLRIPSDQLYFKRGKSEIPEGKADVVLQVGKSLLDVITKNNRIQYINTIFIEGHTDSMRAGKHIAKGNWGLSTFRAITVWDFWRNNLHYGALMASLRNHKGDPIFSVSGYAATRRVNETELTEASMRVNRRIDIRFTMKQPAYQSIIGAREQLQ